MEYPSNSPSLKPQLLFYKLSTAQASYKYYLVWFKRRSGAVGGKQLKHEFCIASGGSGHELVRSRQNAAPSSHQTLTTPLLYQTQSAIHADTHTHHRAHQQR